MVNGRCCYAICNRIASNRLHTRLNAVRWRCVGECFWVLGLSLNNTDTDYIVAERERWEHKFNTMRRKASLYSVHGHIMNWENGKSLHSHCFVGCCCFCHSIVKSNRIYIRRACIYVWGHRQNRLRKRCTNIFDKMWNIDFVVDVFFVCVFGLLRLECDDI